MNKMRSQPIRNKRLYCHQYEENTIGETFTQPSLTIPDQSLSLRDLLERYVMGQNVEKFATVYNGDEDLVPLGIDRMDKMEKTDLARNIRKQIKQIQDNPVPHPTQQQPQQPPIKQDQEWSNWGY